MRSSARWAVNSSTSDGDPLDALGDDVVSQFAVQPGRGGAVLVRVAEDADGVHPGRREERSSSTTSSLGLAGEADDHVRAHARLGGGRADLVEQREEGGAITEAPHPAQHGARRVLE